MRLSTVIQTESNTRNDAFVISRMEGFNVGAGLLCLAVSVSGHIISSGGKLADFSWQPWQEALIYFDSNAAYRKR